MPISSDSILQYKTGTLTGAGPASIVFDNATTQDSVILVVGFLSGNSDVTPSPTFDPPTGGAGNFFQISATTQAGGNRGRMIAYAQRYVASGETTYSMGLTGTPGLAVWAAYEIADCGANGPALATQYYMNCSTAGAAGSSTTTQSTQASGYVPATVESTIDAYNALGVAIYCAENPSSTVPTFSNLAIEGVTLEVQTYTDVTLSNGTYSIAMKICFPNLYEASRYKVSASVSPNSYVSTDFFCLYANDAKMTQKYDVICGGEFGTMSGATTGSAVAAGTAPLDFTNGSPELQTTIKRTGNYAFKISSTSAVENFGFTNSGAMGIFAPVSGYTENQRFHFQFSGSLPSGDVEIAFIEAGTLANGLRVWYRSASQKIAVKVGSGSDHLSDAVISADKWVGIDIRYSPFGTTHTVDWAVHYDSLSATPPVTQTSFTQGSMTDSDPGPRRGYGWNDNTTATMYVDDIAISKQWGTYPIGDIRVRGLTVDPAGSPSVTGSSANFATFANNSDINAWDAVTARNSIDEIPPVFGSTADGITQITVAANDYVTIPMDTFTCAPLYVPRAVRWYVAGWAKSGNPATLRVVSNDGTANVFNVALGDHGFDDVGLVWLCGMQRKKPPGIAAHYQMSQTNLDNLELRVGYSDDANPDVGIHGVIAELAYAPVAEYIIVDAEGGQFRVYVRQDPIAGSVASYLATTPATRGMTVSFIIKGVSSSQYVQPGSTYEKIVSAGSIEDVTSVGVSPDP